MIQTSSLLINSFREITVNHPLWSHEFLIRCRAGNLFLPDVQVLAVQMYKFSKEFNRILASILSCCEDESSQLVILENLFDEMGQGDITQSHPELFRQFTRALGIDDVTLAALPTAPETSALIETYLQMPHKYGYLAALGAVCYASEGIVSSLYTQLYKGIVGAAPLPKESLIFFEVHIDVDDSHAAKLAAVIEPRITMNEEDIKVRLAIVEAMDARVQFFNGIQRQISKYNLSADSWIFMNS
ncbi:MULTISPECIES: TenA family transcriptional regulator [unclassified Nostoc]|uniref:TenA family transcriptional regulator n=1 Tax=unclassified Nostoc TaxID=2593658 RepID=UPI000B958CB9|nr:MULTISPECIES: iron-containing redox enzyme family protein [unclassified Nostoc]AVH65971.1 TENA/THI-4/PQQC family protein [Nostoc sp. 'Peltigera membranacea cyanobiont' N6]OYE05431.1 TenA/THI-4 protein [Nostoc sp. 'Peltigera membranacea cyanobiont' 232]